MKIAILVSFLAVLIVFFVVAQIPVTLTSDEIDRAVTETATPDLPVDEEVLARALMISVEKIEEGTTHALEVSRLRLSRHLAGIRPLCVATRTATTRTRQTPRPARTRIRRPITVP